jgi:CHAD domain-containing protein
MMGSTKTEAIERGAKFDAPMGVALPDLGDLVGRTERLPHQQHETAYFDTSDLRLWDQDITLRHRISQGDGPESRTLKLPEASGGPLLERTEVTWVGSRDQIPQGVYDVVRGLVRREPLQQLTTLEATRQRLVLHGEDDSIMGEIDDDTVTVKSGSKDGLRFRQVELEIRRADPQLVREVTTRLESAGLWSESASKLGKAIGVPAPVGSPQPGRSSLLGDVVRAVITQGLIRLLRHDWKLRSASGRMAPEDVHQARVATRRLRSDLKTFRGVLDPVWVAHARSDLKWLGSLLGNLRDADVLGTQLEGAPDELRFALARQRADGREGLSTATDGNRYLHLLDRLHTASGTPPFLPQEDGVQPEERAGGALPMLVGTQWRALPHQVHKSGACPSDADLHRIRIKAKQLRYAAEAAKPVIGKKARKTAKAAEQLQTLLGEHHNAVATESWLRGQVRLGVTPSSAFEAGRMASDLSRLQSELRHRWHRQWKALAKSKRQAWLR